MPAFPPHLFNCPWAFSHIRNNVNIKGVTAGHQEHKLFLYADDILLVSSNPETTVPIISSLIDRFTKISGYRINWTKSEVMPLSNIATQSLCTKWLFRWVPSGMTYLGNKLMSNISKMMQVNLQPIMQNIESLLLNWSKLHFSLLGRINLIKMIIMPKVKYITYMLPLSFPVHLRKEYDKCVESFIWQGKKPLFNRTKLYSAKNSGGLSLPRLDWYQCSFSLAHISKNNLPHHRAPAWVQIEKELLDTFSIETFVTQKNMSYVVHNPMLKFTRESWKMEHSC